MAHFSPLPRPTTARPWLLALLLLLAAPLVRAQAPAWGGAAAGLSSSASGSSSIRAMTTDASGNVFVTGFFAGTLTVGSTVLTSAGNYDLFVAKYVPGTGTWAWAQSGGGTDFDYPGGIAVSGTSVYVAGTLNNTRTNANAVRFGGTSPATSTTQVNGASATASQDVFLAKYTDNGSSATLRWTQVGGGTSNDQAYAVAVNGTNVYVAGFIGNTITNANAVVFGGGGTTAGTMQVNGASASNNYDVLLAKYTDNGATATLGWTQVGGGTADAIGNGVAVSGTSVYVTGFITNTLTNSGAVVFGGSGTTAGTVPVAGASATASPDVFLAKYTDNGPSVTLGWTQVGGGTGFDFGQKVAVSGTSVYVAGSISNNTGNANAVLFGGSGTTAGTTTVRGATATASNDLVLAKYTDNGATATLGWTQVGGGTDSDGSSGIAVSGTSVYVTGNLFNNLSNANAVVFGSNGTTAGTAPVAGASATASLDLVLAKYTDNGATGTYAWAQVGGGTGIYYGTGVALSGQRVYAAGNAAPPASFGPTTFTTPAGNYLAVLPYLTDATLTPLPTHPAATAGTAGLTLYPNPASDGAATLTGTAPGAAVQVLDALGRLVATTRADAAGTAALGGLPVGLYIVRAGSGAVRLSVE